MTINPANDEVITYRDDNGTWRWRRRDMGNGDITSTSPPGVDGYENKSYAEEAARAYNSDLPDERFRTED
jgi:uncharacterized protein YegP (UPF0339 family)